MLYWMIYQAVIFFFFHSYSFVQFCMRYLTLHIECLWFGEIFSESVFRSVLPQIDKWYICIKEQRLSIFLIKSQLAVLLKSFQSWIYIIPIWKPFLLLDYSFPCLLLWDQFVQMETIQSDVCVDGHARMYQSDSKRHEVHVNGQYGQHLGGPWVNWKVSFPFKLWRWRTIRSSFSSQQASINIG